VLQHFEFPLDFDASQVRLRIMVSDLPPQGCGFRAIPAKIRFELRIPNCRDLKIRRSISMTFGDHVNEQARTVRAQR
jgi:hypothetical protein